jgi:hypothetical protein
VAPEAGGKAIEREESPNKAAPTIGQKKGLRISAGPLSNSGECPRCRIT